MAEEILDVAQWGTVVECGGGGSVAQAVWGDLVGGDRPATRASRRTRCQTVDWLNQVP